MEGDPQNVLRSKNFGGGKADRTPAGEPIVFAQGKARQDPPRGYIKLSQAARAFNFDFRDEIVLDIGSSTGGFTQYALDHGARKVIAVEKGTNQMAAPLRHDPRIELHEKTDIFNFKLSDEINVIVADVSFISLTKILDYLRTNLKNKDIDLLVMLKPQFEARPDQLTKGVVKNEKLRREILKNFEQWLKNHNFVIKAKRDNELVGKHGNKERFYWLTFSNHKHII